MGSTEEAVTISVVLRGIGSLFSLSKKKFVMPCVGRPVDLAARLNDSYAREFEYNEGLTHNTHQIKLKVDRTTSNPTLGPEHR